MCDYQQIHATILSLMPFFLFLIIWEAVWKIIALWQSARNNQLAWFLCIALINTLGILPIVYIILNKKKKAVKEPEA